MKLPTELINLVAEDIEGPRQYDMIHTENFVLVDSKRRIRGF